MLSVKFARIGLTLCDNAHSIMQLLLRRVNSLVSESIYVCNATSMQSDMVLCVVVCECTRGPVTPRQLSHYVLTISMARTLSVK